MTTTDLARKLGISPQRIGQLAALAAVQPVKPGGRAGPAQWDRTAVRRIVAARKPVGKPRAIK